MDALASNTGEKERNEMNARGNEAFAFSDRLPNPDEIENAKQLAKLALPSGFKEGEPEEARFALSCGAERHSVALSPALAASLLEILNLVSSGYGAVAKLENVCIAGERIGYIG